jgi:basic membrane protein A
VALVTDIGGLGDRSFNAEAWHGLQRARVRLGVEIVVRQSRTVNDYYPYLSQMAASHAALIVAIGSSMATSVDAAAKQYPDQRFALVDARPQSSPGTEVNVPNVANLLFSEPQAGYLAGALAGLMERKHVSGASHNMVAWIGGQDIPPVSRYLAGFEAGARHVDPSIKILRDYVGSFDSPSAGRAAAQSQAHAGADIFFQVAAATGAAYLQAAEGRGKFGIGVDTDQTYLGGRTITSAIKRVDVAVYDIVRDVQDGKFRSYDHRYGVADGGAGLSTPSDVVPASVLRGVKRVEQQIRRGTLNVPEQLPAR